MPSGHIRPDPSLRRYLNALSRCVVQAPDLAAALSPVGWPGLAQRLAMEANLADGHGAPHTASIKRDWLRFIGQSGAENEARLLAEVRGPDADRVSAARRAALAARVSASSEIDHALDVFIDRRSTRRDGRARGVSFRELSVAGVILASGATLRAPTLAVAAAARWISDSAPELPPIERFAHRPTNLLTELVADAMPSLLASVPARYVVNALSSPVVLGLRSGRLATTVSISRDAIRVRNGIGRHVTILLHGGAEPFLRRAAIRLEQEAADLETR